MIWLITEPKTYRDFNFEVKREPTRDFIFVRGTLDGTPRTLTLSSLLEARSRATVVGRDNDLWAVSLELSRREVSIVRLKIGRRLSAEIEAAGGAPDRTKSRRPRS